MRVVIEEHGKQRILQIQEFVHYANVVSELGDSSYLAMSQVGTKNAIDSAILDSRLVPVFEYTGMDTIAGLESEDVPVTEYQEYLDYLDSVIESEDNRHPELPLNPTYKEYLDFIGYNYSTIEELVILNPVENKTLTTSALGYIIVTYSDITIPTGLPIGFNCIIIAKTELLELSLPEAETFLSSGSSYEYMTPNDPYEIVKISDSEWLIKRRNKI